MKRRPRVSKSNSIRPCRRRRSEGRKRLMHIPLSFGLIGRNGHDMAYDSVEGAAVENDVIHLRKRHQKVGSRA